MFQTRLVFVALTLATGLGAYLRLDQVAAQVFVNDEWHLVHRLAHYDLVDTLKTFGYADFGIPLAVIYTPLMNWFGLSETMLRIPMLIAGIVSVVLIPLAFRKRFDDRVIAIFALLLAVSPFLISYARIARTYALTALGVYVAFWCLSIAVGGSRLRWRFAIAYALVAAVTVWAHPITGPVLVAPFLFLLMQTVLRRGLSWQQLFVLCGITAALMAMLVLPPLLNDMKALSGKSGVDSIEWRTLVGTAHFWVGSGSLLVVAIAFVLAAIGFLHVWRASDMARWVIVGSALTVIALLLMRPWWVNVPLAFARYLLPMLPVFLLAMAVGLVVACDLVAKRARENVRVALPIALSLLSLALWWPTSPHPETLASPNSYTQDSYFQLDYRTEKNDVRVGWKPYPVSEYWTTLEKFPKASKTVAVAPFHYATFDWPAPLWQQASAQQVIPAFLWGTCVASRHGETPPDERFRFTNAVHASRGKEGMAERGVDYFVYQINQTPNDINPLLPQCEAWVRARFGTPHFEDKTIIVWKLR
jgi:hypothetical protein